MKGNARSIRFCAGLIFIVSMGSALLGAISYAGMPYLNIDGVLDKCTWGPSMIENLSNIQEALKMSSMICLFLILALFIIGILSGYLCVRLRPAKDASRS